MKLTTVLFSMIPAKRKPSRSPDGSSDLRKMSKGFPTDKNPQRKPSLNTNLVNPSADPRRRVERTNAPVQSPISTDGSTYQDAASTRTTPQPQLPAQQVVMTVVRDANDDGDALKKQLLESLVTLTSHITADAALRSSHDLAKRQLENAIAEHQNMKGHFQKYPAIEERTTSDKTKAAEKVAKLEKQLKPGEDSQLKLAAPMCEAIWDLFSKAEASARLPVAQPNAVSREDYEGLQDRFHKQQGLLDQYHDRLEKQSSLIEALMKTVKEASESATQARNQANTVDRTISANIDTLKTRINKVESSEQPEKRKLHDLATTTSKQTSDILLLRSDVSDNKTELTTKGETLATMSSAINSATSPTKTLREDLSKVERQFPAIKNDINQIWAEVSETGKGSVISRLKCYDKTINNLRTKVESNEKAVEACVKAAEDRRESLGQDLTKVRETLADETLADETLGLTQELSKVKASSVAATSVPAPAATSAPTDTPDNFDPASFKEEVVNAAGEQTEMISEEVDKHGEDIEKLKDGLDSLAKKLEDLELGHANGTRQRQSLDQANNDRHASISATCDSIKKTVTAVEGRTDTLQSDITSLSAMVESLQDRPSMSSPPVNEPVVSHFRPLPRPSAQAPSPRTSMIAGSPQTNGIHPSNSTAAPQQMAIGTPAGPSNDEMAVTLDQMQGVWATIHGLRQRIDNLTTEEVVKAMVDQASKMYPAPKEFQAAVSVLQNMDKALDAKLSSLETRLSTLSQHFTALRDNFKNYHGAQLEEKVQLNRQLQQLQGDVANTKQVTNQLPKEINDKISDAKTIFDKAVDAQTDTIVEIRTEVTKIKIELNSVAEVAFGKERE